MEPSKAAPRPKYKALWTQERALADHWRRQAEEMVENLRQVTLARDAALAQTARYAQYTKRLAVALAGAVGVILFLLAR